MDLEDIEAGESPLMYANKLNDSCVNGGKPRSSEYLSEIAAGELTTIITCCIVALVTVLIYAEEVYHLQTRLHDWKPKRKALILLAIYPVTSVNCMCALLMPRATGLCDLCVSLYYALCVFLFSQMLFQHFGGKEKMVRRLRDQTIQLQSPPCCCCFCCLPKPLLNMTRLNVIEFCVMQFVIFKPLAMYILALMVMDAGPNYILDDAKDSAMLYQVMTTLNTCSTFLAVYGNVLLFKMSAVTLKNVNIQAKFYLLQSVVILENLQKFMLAFLVSIEVITCTPPLDTTATSNRFHHQLLIFEMIFLAVAARVYYRHDVMADMSAEDRKRVIPSHSVSVMTTASGYGATDDPEGGDNVITSQPYTGETDSYQSVSTQSVQEII